MRNAIRWVLILIVGAIYSLPLRTVQLLATLMILCSVATAAIMILDERVVVGQVVDEQALVNDYSLVKVKVPIINTVSYLIMNEYADALSEPSRWVLAYGTPHRVNGTNSFIVETKYQSSSFQFGGYSNDITNQVSTLLKNNEAVVIGIGVAIVVFGLFVIRVGSAISLSVLSSIGAWHSLHLLNAYEYADISNFIIYQTSTVVGIASAAIGMRVKWGVSEFLLRRTAAFLLPMFFSPLFETQYGLSLSAVYLVAFCSMILPLLSYSVIGAMLISLGLGQDLFGSLLTWSACFILSALIFSHSLAERFDASGKSNSQIKDGNSKLKGSVLPKNKSLGGQRA